MDKRLMIEIETSRTLKNSEGNDAEALFRLTVPYGIPFDLAKDALEEFKKDLCEMSDKADAVRKAQEAAAVPAEEKKE